MLKKNTARILFEIMVFGLFLFAPSINIKAAENDIYITDEAADNNDVYSEEENIDSKNEEYNVELPDEATALYENEANDSEVYEVSDNEALNEYAADEEGLDETVNDASEAELKDEALTDTENLKDSCIEETDEVLQGAIVDLKGIYVIENNNEHIFAGAVVDNPENYELEYRWIACKEGDTEWFEISPWMLNYEYLDWIPSDSASYVILVQVRIKDQTDEFLSYTGVEFHKYIVGECQMPYEGEGGGYLIGFESKENPNQSFKYEMLILDCTLLAEGKDAWIYTTNPCGVDEGNALWTVWQPEYGYYWTLFRLYDAEGNMIDEVCYGFENVIKDIKETAGLPERDYGWVLGTDGRYYFYNRTTGELQKGGTADGIRLDDDGAAIIDQYAKEKIPVLMHAKAIVRSICSSKDTLAQKQEKCYQYVAAMPYLLKDYPVGDHLNDWACLDAHYANNLINAYGDQYKNGGECVAEAAALGYLFVELNFGDVYLYTSSIHGWIYAGGRYWDPLFVESKGRQYYNAATYESSPTHIYKIN